MKRKLIVPTRNPTFKKKKKNDNDTNQSSIEHFFNKRKEAPVAKKELVVAKKKVTETSDTIVEIVENTEDTTTASAAALQTKFFLSHKEINNKNDGQEVLEIEPDVRINPISIDMDVFDFDPALYDRRKLFDRYKNNILYKFLSDSFFLIDQAKSRLKIVDLLTNMLRVIIYHDPGSVLPAVLLCSNTIAAPFEGLELGIGIGSQILSKSICSISGNTPKSLKSLYDRYGDWGDVAYAAKGSIQTLLLEPKPLVIQDVYKTLLSISKLKGTGVINQKVELVKKLLISCKGEEIKYLTRNLIQNLRIGAVKTTCLIALARAFCLTKPNNLSDLKYQYLDVDLKNESKVSINNKLKIAESLLKECYAQHPCYNGIIKCLLEHPLEKILDICHVTIGVPIRPMLGKITKDLLSLFEIFKGKAFNCEYKYDGQRAQIHMGPDGKVLIFSRKLENITDKYPDIVEVIPKICSKDVDSFILDSEVVAIDSKGGLQNFQTLANRSRKNVDLESITVSVCIFAFDLMHLNGKSLLKSSLRDRRDLLQKNFIQIPERFTFVNQIESSDPEEILDFFKQSKSFPCEGIMIKLLDNNDNSGDDGDNNSSECGTNSSSKSLTGDLKIKRTLNLLATYEPDKRLESWLKVKKDYIENTGDSIDVVPIGAWHGNGRKAGWWSPILLAIYNNKTEKFESLCKCISGFSDEFYREMKSHYSKENNNILEDKKWYFDVGEELKPDVWFEPSEVWEIKGAIVTISPIYKASIGLIDNSKGLSLRFPRFVKVRNDKSIEDATTSEQIADLYYKQQQVKIKLRHCKDTTSGSNRIEQSK
ncbi:9058_t:CDS:2 [Entrophospora sp. SA101]|nr:9058_t:CDS:2 [Entrophospora sp. SA101]